MTDDDHVRLAGEYAAQLITAAFDEDVELAIKIARDIPDDLTLMTMIGVAAIAKTLVDRLAFDHDVEPLKMWQSITTVAAYRYTHPDNEEH